MYKLIIRLINKHKINKAKKDIIYFCKLINLPLTINQTNLLKDIQSHIKNKHFIDKIRYTLFNNRYNHL
jgi:hypothetical protein